MQAPPKKLKDEKSGENSFTMNHAAEAEEGGMASQLSYNLKYFYFKKGTILFSFVQ